MIEDEGLTPEERAEMEDEVIANDYLDEVEATVGDIQAAILSDEEATTVVMGMALPLSHRYDMDQQQVADDINAAFKYKFGMDPSDYADSVRSPSA